MTPSQEYLAEFRKMTEQSNRWFRCPDCKAMGKIDEEQDLGKVSIVCPCGWHGYSKESQTISLRDIGKVNDIL